MPKFIPYDYNQHSMVVINYLDQLQAGTFEYAVHHLVEHKLDLSLFFPHYNNEDGGRLAYDPAILLKIVLFLMWHKLMPIGIHLCYAHSYETNKLEFHQKSATYL